MKNREEETFKQSYESNGEMGRENVKTGAEKEKKDADDFFNTTPGSE